MLCVLIPRCFVFLSFMPAARDCQSYLHDIKIMHRDLKTTNVLVSVLPSKSTAGIFKISDFGVSCTVKPNAVHMTACGTEGLTFTCRGFSHRVCKLDCRKLLVHGDFYDCSVEGVGCSVGLS